MRAADPLEGMDLIQLSEDSKGIGSDMLLAPPEYVSFAFWLSPDVDSI